MSAQTFAVTLLATAVFGCDATSKHIDQKIDGVVSFNERPTPGLALRLQADGSSTCDSGSLSFTTDAKGSFSGSRKADIGRLAVIVQKDTLCVLDGQRWRAVWHGTYGPAPEALNFKCNRNGSEWKCTMNGLESHERKA